MMKRELNKTKLFKVLVAVVAGGLLVGCAGHKELRAEIDEVRAIAEQSAADAAAAQSSADAAMGAAASAKAQSEETQTKIDRMFKKAMYK